MKAYGATIDKSIKSLLFTSWDIGFKELIYAPDLFIKIAESNRTKHPYVLVFDNRDFLSCQNTQYHGWLI